MTTSRLLLPAFDHVFIVGVLDNEADTQRVNGNDPAADWARRVSEVFTPSQQPAPAAARQLVPLELAALDWSFVRAVVAKWSVYASTTQEARHFEDLLTRIDDHLPGLPPLPGHVLEPETSQEEPELSDEEAIARLEASSAHWEHAGRLGAHDPWCMDQDVIAELTDPLAIVEQPSGSSSVLVRIEDFDEDRGPDEHGAPPAG
ncbi:hypothetical protein [Kineococcus terrestris]|uniref:hypothetical protein n=1 Tax=Kineococcus terrestris TaxID=2044856 RepID=UPI0034DB14B1